jgi:hypothetical protein
MLPKKRTKELQVFESEWEKFDIVRQFARASGFLAKPGKFVDRLLRHARVRFGKANIVEVS